MKVTTTSSFTQDLGLDSLDAVEVVMAIEEEFSIESPSVSSFFGLSDPRGTHSESSDRWTVSDEDADKITTVGEAIDYIAQSKEAH